MRTLRTLVTMPGAHLPAVALGLSALIGGFSLWSYPKIEKIVRDQVSEELLVTRNAAVSAVTQWFATAERAGYLLLEDQSVRSSLQACVSSEGPCDGARVASSLWPYLQTGGFSGFLVVDPSGHVRAGDTDANQPHAVPEEVQGRTLRLTPGKMAATTPFMDVDRPVFWTAALILPPHVGGGAPSSAGTLLLRLPLEALNNVLHVARPGASGETYAFDRKGRFLTQSRFLPQLREAGLLAPTADSSLLRVDLRDPGVDLTRGLRTGVLRRDQPLTRMARDAVSGGSFVDITGYRDYRGVPVVGAWQWLPELGIGIATEVDIAEAFLAPSKVKDIFLTLLMALVAASVALLAGAWVTVRLRNRVRQAEILTAQFGQYRIVRTLGTGGMGTVYLANHQFLKRPAAIKLLRQDRATDETLARFEQEVQVTSTLIHPNTVAVYDYGISESGAPYYVMEYVEGVDLQHLVERFGPLPEARVIHLIRQLCGSLSEAHAAGLVHRDIKPANLMVCKKLGASDTLKVLDFGVVKSVQGERLGLTQGRIVLGTPEYMAPEMFESAANASPQTDLYAVGCVAYFLLTGTPVFDGASAAELCLAHLTLTPTTLSARRGTSVDPALESVVLSCLAKKPEARPRTAGALRVLLDRSENAHTWTTANADAWWIQQAEAVESLQASAATTSAPSRPVAIKPARA